MIGQLSVSDDGGYWKDECVNLDYKMLAGLSDPNPIV